MEFRALSLLVSDPREFLTATPHKPVVFGGRRDAVRGLFTYDDVDDLLSSRSLRIPNVSLLNTSMPAPSRAFADAKFPTEDIADPLAVAAYLQNGYSITFNQLHAFLPPLGELASRLEYEMGCPVEVTAFVTPPGAKALSPHHDTVSTFLCQTEGTKHWKLARPVVNNPHPEEKWDWAYLDADEQERVLSGEPDLEVTLQPGMCLWIPRGWVHSAVVDPDSQTSVHLTLEIRRESRYWLARQLVDYLGHISYLREDLPAGQTTAWSQEEDDTAGFLDTLAKLVASVDTEDFRRYAAHQHRSRFRGPKIRPVRDVLESERTSLADAVIRLDGIRGHEWENGILRLHLGGAERNFEGDEAQLLRTLIEQEPESALLPIAVQALGEEGGRRFVQVLLALGVARMPQGNQVSQPAESRR